MPSSSSETPVATQVRGRIVDPVLLLVALIWGVNNVAVKWVLEYIGPAGTLVLRYIGCALIMGMAAWLVSRRRGASMWGPWKAMAAVGALVGVQQLAFMFALDLTTASEASLLISVAPIWTALAGAVTGIERLSPANWLGIVGASAGVAMIVLGGGNLDATAPHRIAGDLLMLFSSVLYGVGMTWLKTIMERFGALRVLTWAFVFGSLLVVPCGMGDLRGVEWAALPLLVWGTLAYSAFISGGFGFVAWYRTIARTTATSTAVYQYLVPVVALVGAALMLGERLGVLQITGALLAISGLALARRSG